MFLVEKKTKKKRITFAHVNIDRVGFGVGRRTRVISQSRW